MGSDPAPDPLKTPAYHGDAVAKKIDAALSPMTDTDGGGLRVAHGTDAPTGDDAKSEAMKADDQGKTWAEIVGDDALVNKRIAADSETAVVKAASFAGEPKADDIPDSGAISDGAQYLGAYKGIEGTIFCHGECKVKDGKLAGAWYFTPNNPKKPYVKAAGGSTYEAETLYAQYGHWLRVANGNTTVHTYALTSHAGTPNWETLNVQANATTLKDASASYKGSAAGMSVHETYKTDGTVEKTQSGAFTAAVTLTAKFGGTPFLGGKVSNFQGDAVNSDWSVTLTEAAVTSGGVGDTEGRTSGYATGQAGKWSATSYGKNGARPMGIFGGFNAHFTDGAAAGAYATRKQ